MKIIRKLFKKETMEHFPSALSLVPCALILCFLLEWLCRRSPVQGVLFIVQRPLMFLYNSALILLTLSPCLLFSKKRFVFSLSCVLWLTLGVIELVLKGFRTTPLSAIDFELIPSVLPIIHVYLSTVQSVLLGITAAAVLGGLILLWFRCPRQETNLRAAARLLGSAALSVTLMTVLLRGTGLIPRTFGNISDAYDDYGFAYCFSCSIVDRGISRPGEYSEETMETLAQELEDEFHLNGMRPNLVMLQLESFMDVQRMDGLSFSKDPTPNFRRLRGMCPSGSLIVPSIGAGTANTEFEVITGMSLDYFGPGEYPYKTVLRDQTCESVCTVLKEAGYSTHAIHNNSATFYARDEVFPNLGFDTFTSLEYMPDAEYNPIGWCDDSVLTEEILSAMDSTPGRDFTYAISVQGHGKYPREEIDYDNRIKVSGLSEDWQIPFEYYVNQIYEMDEFIGELLTALANYPEPVVLVLYGDHLPNFEVEEVGVEDSELFCTEYAIWNNFGLRAQDEDLYAYQLYSHVLSLYGMEDGLIGNLHRSRKTMDEEVYQEELELLEYDMLFGDREIYDGREPYQPTEMTFGTRPIRILKISRSGEEYFVQGENFTPFSRAVCNEEKLDTIYVSPYLLRVQDKEAEEKGVWRVEQVGQDGKVLSSTNDFASDC